MINFFTELHRTSKFGVSIFLIMYTFTYSLNCDLQQGISDLGAETGLGVFAARDYSAGEVLERLDRSFYLS